MPKQAVIVLQQTHHGVSQAQLAAISPPGGHPAQQTHRLSAWPQPQLHGQAGDHQQRDGTPRKQLRPRGNLLDTRVGPTQPP